METEGFTPKDFMKSRHPDLFSDSSFSDNYRLTPSILEYNLDTLTNRKQEYDFENFCRLLAEKEICPNLLPQTGPIGGGDSKVDSENYPVADEIIDNFYEGIPRTAGTERWAFAFSAKKQWSVKAKSDVEKISKTGRDYRLIYFITSRFVKDKKRIETEEKLTTSYGIPVRILDRTWIVTRVIEHGLEEIAIEALHLSVPSNSELKLGPLDASRKSELDELDAKLRNYDKYYGSRYFIIEDYLRAAKLARGLSCQRNTIFGYFYQARRLADKSSNKNQLIRVIYNEAWTAYWWFNDISEFDKLYEQIEPLCINSEYISELENLHTLWMIYYSSIRTGLLSSDDGKYKARTDRLIQALEHIGNDSTKPNSSLQAKTIIHFIKLLINIKNPDSIRRELKGLHDCIANIDGLALYPVHVFVRMITDTGQFFSEYTEYDDLMDTLTTITGERESETQVGLLFLRRGLNKLKAEKYFEALKLLSKARENFTKEETLSDMVQTNMACSIAYEKMGLLWAARMEVIFALSLMLNPIRSGEEISYRVLICIQHIISLELRLGRIECVLQWYNVRGIISQALGPDYHNKSEIENDFLLQDAVLGMLILKLDLESLSHLEKLPDVLDGFGLIGSRAALLYSLGYCDQLRKDGMFPEKHTQDEIDKHFLKWLEQPAIHQIPNITQLHCSEFISYTTTIIGCRIVLSVQNNLDCIVVAENILGTLEAFLATVGHYDLIFHVPELRIKLTQSSSSIFPGQISLDDSTGTKVLNIDISDETNYKKNYTPQQAKQYTTDLLLKIVSHILSMGAVVKSDDFQDILDKLGKEGVFSRALNMSPISHQIKNILGDNPKYHISEWQTENGLTPYKLNRKEKWYTPSQIHSQDNEHEESTSSEPIAGLDQIQHKDYYISSHINVHLWDKAGWSGVGFMLSADQSTEPLLGIIFNNYDVGKQIFNEWIEKIGQIDKHEELRISIVENIEPNSPNYKVIIGIEMDNIIKKRSSSEIPLSKLFVMTSRIHTMYPRPDSKNLNMFKEQYTKHGSYRLIPCMFNKVGSMDAEYQLSIKKSVIHFRSLKDIGNNDPDMIAFK